MVKIRDKMYNSNAKIKLWLKNHAYIHIYLFPHTRFLKDYHFEDEPFDGMAWKESDRCITLFQNKTNCKPTKKTLIRYKEIESKWNVKLLWFNVRDYRGVEVYGLSDTKPL